MMTRNEVSKVIVDAALEVHRALGPGLLESVYENALAHELELRGLRIQRQVAIPATYETLVFEIAFRADLIVEDKVVVELKSIEELTPVHSKQFLTYLKLADKRLGLLINFNVALLKNGLHRIVNQL